jgi:hypothetical protein
MEQWNSGMMGKRLIINYEPQNDEPQNHRRVKIRMMGLIFTNIPTLQYLNIPQQAD